MKPVLSDPTVPFIASKDRMPEEDLRFARVPAGSYTKGEEMLLLREVDLTELSELLGRNISDRDDLLLAARNLTTLSIDGIEGAAITLDSYLLNRLRSRCQENDFGAFVRRVIMEQLAAFCGC